MTPIQTFDFVSLDDHAGDVLRDAVEKDGAVLVQGVLSREEVRKLRDQVQTRLTTSGRRLSLGRTLPGAATAQELGWALAHPRIVAVFRRLLGEQLLFTGHCDIHMSMLSGWHKDSGEDFGGYFRGDYFGADDCRVYKAAIYLQDATQSDGLTVRLGSQRTPDLRAGREVTIKTVAGDVVFFDVRLNHRGQLPDLVEKGIKAATRLATRGSRVTEEPEWASSARATYWSLRGRRDRVSVFFTYGAPNDFTEQFASANLERQRLQSGHRSQELPNDLRSRLEAQGVRLSEVIRPCDGPTDARRGL